MNRYRFPSRTRDAGAFDQGAAWALSCLTILAAFGAGAATWWTARQPVEVAAAPAHSLPPSGTTVAAAEVAPADDALGDMLRNEHAAVVP